MSCARGRVLALARLRIGTGSRRVSLRLRRLGLTPARRHAHMEQFHDENVLAAMRADVRPQGRISLSLWPKGVRVKTAASCMGAVVHRRARLER